MGFPIADGSRDPQMREGAAIRRLRSAISGRHAPMAKDALTALKCRCGTHMGILRAVKRAAEMMG